MLKYGKMCVLESLEYDINTTKFFTIVIIFWKLWLPCMPHLLSYYLELLWVRVRPCYIRIKKCPCKMQLGYKTACILEFHLVTYSEGHVTDPYWELLTYESKQWGEVLGIQRHSGISKSFSFIVFHWGIQLRGFMLFLNL